MKAPFSTAVAIGVGLVVLLGYFLPIVGLGEIRTILVGWAITLAAIATLIGVVNLLSVHFKKIAEQQPRSGYSILLIAGFLIVLLLGIWEALFSPQTSLTEQVVNAIQLPVESSLMAVLAASLAFASIRMLSRRQNLVSILFFISTLVFLVISSGVLGMFNIDGLQTVQNAFNRLPVAGGRGLLLGVALGSLLTGLRILVGADRPYRG
jgi:hypothetical protein